MNGNEQLTSNKMRDMPVGRLLFVMSAPAIISMLVQALYNIVDSVFVGIYYSGTAQYDGAVQALSLAFPMQLLITAVGIGIGVGANACISRRLGEGDREGANKVANLALLLSLAGAALTAIVGLFASEPFVRMLAAESESGSSGDAIAFGTQYLTIVMALSFGAIIEITCARLYQSTGNMRIPMMSQAMGAVLNIVLDAVFIFVFNMGVAGVAWATVIAQTAAAAFSLSMFFLRKHDVQLHRKYWRPERKTFKQIFNVGLPAFTTQAVGSVTYVVMMIILKMYNYGSDAQSVYGFYFKLISFITMPVFGLMQGMLPILGYNYGSGNRLRYVKTLKLSLIFALSVLTAGLILFETLPGVLLSAFSVEWGSSMMQTGQFAYRITAISFVPAAFGITTINAFQSLHCGISSLLVSVLRQIGIIIPFALIFGSYNIMFVWMAYPIAETVSVLIFFPRLLAVIKKKFDERTSLLTAKDGLNGQAQLI